MPVHDWSRVEAAIFHDFHHAWIEEIKRSLNGGLLPDDYYAMAEQLYAIAEQHAAGFGPDVLTLQTAHDDGPEFATKAAHRGGDTGLLQVPPKVWRTAETAMEFYRRKQNTVTVRHVNGDTVVAMVEVVSPGNKLSRSAFRSFVEKAGELLDKQVHLLILDLQPRSQRDPHGVHAAIWDEITGENADATSLDLPAKPLTLVAYESALTVCAFVEPVAIGDALCDMPLFLEPGAHVSVPLEKTYQAAFAAVPRRWRNVLASA